MPSRSDLPTTLRTPSIAGIVLSMLGVFTAIAAVALMAAVIWLELTRGDEVAYLALAIRVTVIGGFLLVLAWLLWKVGLSMGASRRGAPVDRG